MCKRRLLVVGLFIIAGPLQRSTAVAAGEDDYLPDRYGHVHGQPKAYTAVFAPLFAVYTFYVLTTYSAFLYRAVYLRDKSLVERSVFLLSAHTLSGTLVASSALVHGFMANFPCFIDMWMLSVGYIMWFATIILYMARYYVVVRWHKSIETEQRVNPVTPDNLVEYMTRLRVATQGVYWQNAADLDAVVGTDQLAVGAQIRDSQVGDAQIKVGRPSLIGRILSWRRRREEEIPGVSESDTKVSEQGREQPSFVAGVDEIALDVFPSDNERGDIVFGSGGLPQRAARMTSFARLVEKFNDKWTRRCRSNRFAAYVLLGVLVLSIGYMAILSSLFTRLKLGRIYYNCFNGPEYISQGVIAGMFNIIIFPAYVVVIWRYHDAYAIRNLMCASCVLGVVLWSMILVWRLNRRWGNIFISTYIIYVVQMALVYTCYAVIPLVKSIWFSYAQRRRIASGAGDNVEHGGSAHYDPDDLFQTTNDSAKREFLDDMQHADKHGEVKRFAALCFCSELVSFLDVFQAFKNCVYQDMLASVSRPVSSAQVGNSADLGGAISELQSSVSSTQSTNQSVVNGAGQSMYSGAARSMYNGTARSMYNGGTARSSESRAAASPRTSMVLGGKNLAQAIFNRDGLRSALRPKRKQRKQHNQVNRQEAADEHSQTSANLRSLTTGIAKTMAQAFPDQGIGGHTEFAESLREPLCALINTFVLPESPLALNVASNIVSAARSYLGGGAITYSTIDQVVGEAINLLYSNVYVRYHQP
ncbi:hypothetical protein IW146_002966 [Coemansia sp. RSA 922]|nr:hypothetical protein IW146_002966 [Coemansia sp. RSA 922]